MLYFSFIHVFYFTTHTQILTYTFFGGDEVVQMENNENG